MPPEGATNGYGRTHLRLFGCWDLRVSGREVEIGRREQRLVALLALRGRRPRPYVAGTLWPATTETRAQASLRAAVLHTRQAVPGLLDVGRASVALAADVTVDLEAPGVLDLPGIVLDVGLEAQGLVEGDLLWTYDMAAVGQKLQPHLWGRLVRQ